MSAPREVVQRSDSVELVLLPEAGGRIHRLRVDGVDVLRTPDDPARHRQDPWFWGAYPMAPWCNRAPAEPFKLAGRTVDLAANFPDGTAIHGLVATRAWAVRADSSLGITHDEVEAGWPWSFGVVAGASVRGRTVALDYELANRSDAPMPAGLGLHPWFATPVAVALPAGRVYGSNSGSPAEPSPVSGDLDLREGAVPATGLDGTWTRLERPAIDLAWSHLGLTARISVTTTARCVAVATPHDLGAIAVEPQTHGPDPFRRLAAGEPDAPAMLGPGESLRLGLRIAFGRTPAA